MGSVAVFSWLVAAILLTSNIEAGPSGSSRCPPAIKVYYTKPVCRDDYDCKNGKICCPNQAHTKSCTYPAPYTAKDDGHHFENGSATLDANKSQEQNIDIPKEPTESIESLSPTSNHRRELNESLDPSSDDLKKLNNTEKYLDTSVKREKTNEPKETQQVSDKHESSGQSGKPTELKQSEENAEKQIDTIDTKQHADSVSDKKKNSTKSKNEGPVIINLKQLRISFSDKSVETTKSKERQGSSKERQLDKQNEIITSSSTDKSIPLTKPDYHDGLPPDKLKPISPRHRRPSFNTRAVSTGPKQTRPHQKRHEPTRNHRVHLSNKQEKNPEPKQRSRPINQVGLRKHRHHKDFALDRSQASIRTRHRQGPSYYTRVSPIRPRERLRLFADKRSTGYRQRVGPSKNHIGPKELKPSELLRNSGANLIGNIEPGGGIRPKQRLNQLKNIQREPITGYNYSPPQILSVGTWRPRGVLQWGQV